MLHVYFWFCRAAEPNARLLMSIASIFASLKQFKNIMRFEILFVSLTQRLRGQLCVAGLLVLLLLPFCLFDEVLVFFVVVAGYPCCAQFVAVARLLFSHV